MIDGTVVRMSFCFIAADPSESDPQAPTPATGHQPGQTRESGHASRDEACTTRQRHQDGTVAGRGRHSHSDNALENTSTKIACGVRTGPGKPRKS